MLDSGWRAAPPEPGEREWAGPLTVSITLSALHGGTVVEFVQTGFEGLGDRGPATCQSFEAGWDLSELKALKAAIEG